MTTSRLCKYHGRSCEHPGACLNRSPRKYEGDGHLEHIDPERLTLGNVLRMNGKGLPTFSDTVIIGIFVQYGRQRTMRERCDKRHFKTLAEALAHAERETDYVVLKMARPYLYASNAVTSMPNWLTGVETYEIFGNRLEDTHKVVVQATGEYATHMSRELLRKWEVKVSGAGSESWAPQGGLLYSDFSEGGARESYKIHRQMAQGAYGRKGGETVTLLCEGEVIDQYVGNMGGVEQ